MGKQAEGSMLSAEVQPQTLMGHYKSRSTRPKMTKHGIKPYKLWPITKSNLGF